MNVIASQFENLNCTEVFSKYGFPLELTIKFSPSYLSLEHFVVNSLLYITSSVIFLANFFALFLLQKYFSL